MDWNQKYIELYEKNKKWGFRYIISCRKNRFKSNPPIKPEHFSELEYLILNYDNQISLLRKYENLISEDTKEKWLEKKLNEKYPTYNILILLPFYLINPNTKNLRINKYFLNDQLMLILGGINHKFRKYRLRANYLFQFITPNYSKLNRNIRRNIIELFTITTTTDNIHIIKGFLLSNWANIDKELLIQFFEEQLKRELITPKMAIGIYKKGSPLNSNIIHELEKQILKLDNGKYILKKINPAPNNA